MTLFPMMTSDENVGAKRGATAGPAAKPTNTAGPVPATYLNTQVPGAHESQAAGGLQNQGVVDASMNAVVNQLSGLGINSAAVPGMVAGSYTTPDGQIIYTTGYPPAGMQAFGYGQASDASSAAFGAAYLPQSGFGGYPAYLPYHLVQYAPGRTGIMPERSETSSKDVPGLENRRSSHSTTESTPTTPFFGSMTSRDQGARVTVFDRSTYTTPSPQQIAAGGAAQQPKAFYAVPIPVDRDLDALLRQEPAIPSAVPAVFTPPENMKTLEQSMVNVIPGNRNVYIRGLHPTTDDELLYKYAERFGRVETSKAIIDTATGACKGFGFAKFYNERDSEMCIRGFYRLGYEVGFARVSDIAPHITPCIMCGAWADLFADQESFNSRLKAEGDEQSTNLYISNLPKSLTEAELGAIFLGFTILSSKILRDNLGNSRGVGFARFESREVCDEIIQTFTGIKLGEEGLHMQLRYADTPAQKELKRVTAERRQFRTNEYNVGAYGTPLVGMNPTIYNQPSYRRGPSGTGVPAPRGPSSGSARVQRGAGGGRSQPSSVATGNVASSEDGSGDEGVTIHVDSPLVANGSTRSSPVKQEKD
ncbi:hypothetical protein F4779DRAFT_559781 [Xylariaceae sp. FL0662B]|nr:hypothetical protein F4779DRAFT_559781 [Xylariaceae sp. FL0662B]